MTQATTPAPTPPPGQQVIGVVSTPGAPEVYQALRASRSELRSQLEQLEERRQELSGQLRDSEISGVERKGVEQRIADVDARIAGLDKQIAAADAEVARAAAVPGAIVPEIPIPRSGPPDEAFVLAGIFMFVVVLPLTIAYARRIWRRGAAVITSLPAELSERLTRIEQAVDAIAVEVERVGEGQRYVTHLVSESGPRALGAGAAEPIQVRQREASPHARP